MPKDFLRFIKEEAQQGVDYNYGFWFYCRGIWAAKYQGGGSYGALGNVSSWGGDAGTDMVDLPPFMLDMFDYNGDGIIGSNDQAILREISDLIWEVYDETGEMPPPITAADYLDNWAWYRVLYAKDFPDPNGYAFLPWGNADGPTIEIADADNPGISANSILGWAGGFTFWQKQFYQVQQNDPTFWIEIYGQDVYDQIMATYDLDGDGELTGYATNYQGTASAEGDSLIYWLIVYYMQERGFGGLQLSELEFPKNINDFFYNATRLTNIPLQDLVNDFFGIEGLPFRPTPPEQPPESPGGDMGGEAPVRP